MTTGFESVVEFAVRLLTVTRQLIVDDLEHHRLDIQCLDIRVGLRIAQTTLLNQIFDHIASKLEPFDAPEYIALQWIDSH